MRQHANGFARPTVTRALTAVEDQAIAEVCPGLNVRQNAGDRHDDFLWGPIVSLYRGHATNAPLRHQASSGGALSAMLQHLLARGLVKFVVQTGASRETPYANAEVVSDTPEAVYRAAGSRYAPSSPLANIERHLSRGAPFAFVGKPCDVAALRALARRDPRVDELIPYAFSFFCAGVPSGAGAEKLIEKMGLRTDDVVEFRYRGDGWPGYATAVTRDRRELRMSYHASWGEILSKRLQLRCKICPDGVGGFADVVCADAWECDADGYPMFEERDGVSLVVGRTEKGAELIAAAAEAGDIALAPARVADIAAMQPSQARRKRLVLSRVLALKAFARPTPRYAGLNLGRAARSAGLGANLKSFLGTCRRVVFGWL